MVIKKQNIFIAIMFAILCLGFYALQKKIVISKISAKILDIDMYFLEKCPVAKQDGNTKLYGQYYEDYILSSVFEGQNTGAYIDVGANDPEHDTATKYFYLKGWKGMNFEPQDKYYNILLDVRTRDININMAAADSEGESTLYIPNGREGWTTMEHNISDVLEKDNVSYESKIIKITTLNKEIEKYNFTNIDLLKIDVESYEDVVLKGINLTKYRPKVIVAEARSSVDFNGNLKFEPILIQNNYKFGMEDGLNYYYYREESPEFAEKFKKIRKCVLLSQLKRNIYCQNKENCNF